jgi:hypothetical protein
MRRSRSEDAIGRGRGLTRHLASAGTSTTIALALAVCGCGATPPTPAGPTAASCPVDRGVVLASRADLARIATCRTLAGVTIRSGAALDTSALRALETITGDLVIGPTVAVDEVKLGGLRTVEGAIRVVGNGLMQGLYLSRLERAGRITIDGNVALTTISLPRLATVGALHITDNANLELVDLSALTAIDGELVLARAPRLSLVEAAQLRRAASVLIDAPKLPSDTSAQLRAVAVSSPAE